MKDLKLLQDLHLAIFLGGPSNERDISLDSARTFFDSIRKSLLESNITLVFVSLDLQFYHLNHNRIYSNTCEDFEELLLSGSRQAGKRLSQEEVQTLIAQADVLCPLIHGEFGEDGELSKRFEKAGRKAIVGSPSDKLSLTLDKARTAQFVADSGLPHPNFLYLTTGEWQENREECLNKIQTTITPDEQGQFIVKPNNCGSSDGVSLVEMADLDQAIQHASQYTDQILLEDRIQGREFSLILLQDNDDTVIPLVPTEIHLLQHQSLLNIYSRAKKYLPGSGAHHLTPMPLAETTLEKIRQEGSELFKSLGMSDWARFDGFFTEEGQIIWSDLNGIPGCGQDSFLFQQASLFGLDSHHVALLLLSRALSKENVTLEVPSQELPANQEEKKEEKQKKLAILGGGMTSERHVSRMSWFNVIQKFNALNQYEIHNIFLDKTGEYWIVPRFITLQHTVEEIENLLKAPKDYQVAIDLVEKMKGNHFQKFSHSVKSINFIPKKTNLASLAKQIDFVFLALHGGIGENGKLQKQLKSLGIGYNGSHSEASRICMDKSVTNQKCNEFGISGFIAPLQRIESIQFFREELNRKGFSKVEQEQLIQDLQKNLKSQSLETIQQFFESPSYQKLSQQLQEILSDIRTSVSSQQNIVLKPKDDGCSTGVIVAKQMYQVPLYLLFAMAGIESIPFALLYEGYNDPDQDSALKMPSTTMSEILFEQFIGGQSDQDRDDFIEMTVGVLGKQGEMIAMLPSETLAKEDVLSLDEKFNKGGGTNLTPPPQLSTEIVVSIQDRIIQFANQLGIANYARIDVIYQQSTDQLYLIEVNTLPGLTPATIIYTQAMLTPEINLKPSEFLNHLVQTAIF